MRSALACAALTAALAPAGAWAGETACWYEQGVIVAPASVAGAAGDYILDTGSPVTMMHETRAQAEGLSQAAGRGAVQVAGLTLPDRPFVVADLDARTWAFPTPIAGVIGADLLADYVVDVSFSPCRVAIYPLRRAPAFRAAASLTLQPHAGAATAHAAVSDGTLALGGDFVVSTGSDTPIRLADRLAAVPGLAKPDQIQPYGAARARLRAASFAGALFENLDGGLVTEAGAASGVIGAPLLSRWRLRFDFPRGRLLFGS